MRHRVTPRAAPLVVLGIVAAYFALLFSLGGYHAWDELGVPARGEPTFLDLRSVTTGWECTRRGIDVLPRNPCDPFDRPANYPRIWMVPSFLGLGDSSTIPLGFAICAIFFLAAALVLPDDTPVWAAVVYGVALCSPAVMLGVARANVDMALFALVGLAFRYRRSMRRPTVAASLVLAAAVLKLYPILAAPALLLRRTRGAALAFGAVAVGFGAYALITLHDIETIGRVVPEVDGYSYGVRILAKWLAAGPTRLSVSAWVAVLLAAVVTVALASQRALRRSAMGAAAGVAAELFVAGGCVYVGTYAAVRSWDYRLAFLLLCIPQLLIWTRRGSALAIVSVVALVATLWLNTPWGGVPTIYDALQRWQNAIAAHTPFQRVPLTPGALTQFVLFAALVPALVAVLRVPARIAVESALLRPRRAPQRAS